MQKRFWLIWVVLLFTGAGCGKAVTPSPTSPPVGVKSPLHGLVTMGSVQDLRKGQFDALKEARVHPDVYSGVVIRATWGTLEPQRGVFDFSPIEKALEDIAAYNAAHPQHPLAAKLRVSATVNPPAWVLSLGGGPVEVVVNDRLSYPIGLFWTDAYRDAWRELQQALAKAYDDNPLIREVCVTSPAMATDEPLATIFNPPTVRNLQQKGFTDAAFQRALEGTLDDYAVWQHTPLDFSFNMHRRIDSGRPVNDMDFTLHLMEAFRARFGERAVLSNHGLRAHLSRGALPVYQAFAELGAPIAVQTKGPKDLTDEAFRLGLHYGVSEFEIWDSREAGGYADFTLTDLQRWANMLAEGAP